MYDTDAAMICTCILRIHRKESKTKRNRENERQKNEKKERRRETFFMASNVCKADVNFGLLEISLCEIKLANLPYLSPSSFSLLLSHSPSLCDSAGLPQRVYSYVRKYIRSTTPAIFDRRSLWIQRRENQF